MILFHDTVDYTIKFLINFHHLLLINIFYSLQDSTRILRGFTLLHEKFSSFKLQITIFFLFLLTIRSKREQVNYCLLLRTEWL